MTTSTLRGLRQISLKKLTSKIVWEEQTCNYILLSIRHLKKKNSKFNLIFTLCYAGTLPRLFMLHLSFLMFWVSLANLNQMYVFSRQLESEITISPNNLMFVYYHFQIEQKIKYAVWKAAEIRKALKEGRKPQPGPPGADQDLSSTSGVTSSYVCFLIIASLSNVYELLSKVQ